VVAWQSIDYLFRGWEGFGIDFFKGIFEAIAIAMVIGLTVDQFLSKRFAREAFLASVGYVLPQELRPEMQWLCQLRVLCTQDVVLCTFTPIGDSVKFHVHRTQVVKNISNATYSLPVGLGIDQWFRSEADSRIIKFAFVTDRQNWTHSGAAKKSPYGLNLPDGTPDVL